jgi:hypothetical protein
VDCGLWTGSRVSRKRSTCTEGDELQGDYQLLNGGSKVTAVARTGSNLCDRPTEQVGSHFIITRVRIAGRTKV